MARYTRPTANEGSGTPCIYCSRIMIPTSNATDKNAKVRELVSTVDHKRARSRGGDNHPSNLVFSCARCNSLKGSVLEEIFIMFAHHVLQRHPNAENIYLRSALLYFMTQLAEIAIRNKQESKRAITRTVNNIENELKKAHEI
jgi:hypothetical protein